LKGREYFFAGYFHAIGFCAFHVRFSERGIGIFPFYF
jgi:hypothetical protein